MSKKTIADMSKNWHKDHQVTGLASTEIEFCRDIGVTPSTPTPEEAKSANEDFDSTVLTLSMIQDIIHATDVLMLLPETSQEKIEHIRRMRPYLERAYLEMRKAGKIISNIDPEADDDTMPNEDEDEDEEFQD